jgi:hypothetical protein
VSRRALGLVLAATAALLLAPVPARAAAPAATGWWWLARASGAPTPSPPSVPDGGLYVASNPTGAEALAAMRFSLAADRTPTLLRLGVASSQGTPVVLACPVDGTWAPADGGAWEDRPGVACGDRAVAGTVAPDGASITFDVSKLETGPSLDVAIVPAADPALPGAGATFQLAIAPPAPDTLTTTAAATSPAAITETPPADQPAAEPLQSASAPLPETQIPIAAGAVTAAGDTAPATALVPAAGVVRPPDDGVDGKRWVAALILLVVGAGVAAATRRAVTDDRGIGPFARPVERATAPRPPVIRGIGRFARPR